MASMIRESAKRSLVGTKVKCIKELVLLCDVVSFACAYTMGPDVCNLLLVVAVLFVLYALALCPYLPARLRC